MRDSDPKRIFLLSKNKINLFVNIPKYNLSFKDLEGDSSETNCDEDFTSVFPSLISSMVTFLAAKASRTRRLNKE